MVAQPPCQPLTPPGRGTTRRVSSVLGAVLVASWVAAGPAVAMVSDDSSQATLTAVFAAESWYRPAPTCDLPTGCLPVSAPAGYPDGTLHVGVLAGQEESRTYLSLRLPASGLEGGALQLPVAAAADGTVQAGSAKLRACLVTADVKDKVAGDMTKAPNADCSVSSPALAKSAGTQTVLTVDLAPFVTEWSGAQVGSLALVPGDAPAATDVWHLAFSRHDRTGTGVQPLSATLLVSTAESPTVPPTDAPIVPAPEVPVATLNPPVTSGAVPAPGVDGPVVQGPTVAQPAALVPAAGVNVDTSFAYPGVFLLPPLALLAAAWLARAFSRDLAEEPS